MNENKPTSTELEDVLADGIKDLMYSIARDEPEEVSKQKATNLTQAITRLIQQERADSKYNRYCGVCYKPSIENGGWWCPEHGYKSVYIPRSEASELRESDVRLKQAEERGRIDELKRVREASGKVERMDACGCDEYIPNRIAKLEKEADGQETDD